MNIYISNLILLALSIFILYIGEIFTNKSKYLKEYNIPSSVTGGFVFALIFSFLAHFNILKLNFDFAIRDFFLLFFFACVGLSSKISLLLNGGKTLLKLMIVIICFIFLQNLVGVCSAWLMNINLIKGLLAGSIAFAGGHGTAITWSKYFITEGYGNFTEFALLAATFGLICGGLLGGPISQRLICKKNLVPTKYYDKHYNVLNIKENVENLNNKNILRILFEVSLSIGLGELIHNMLKSKGIVMPDFLPVLFVGMLITNITDFFNFPISNHALDVFGEISLDLFVVITLFSLNLHNIDKSILPLLVITAIQCVFIGFFAYYIFFRFAGKDYDAAVMTSGFVGCGLGATPVGMANMEAVIHHFGLSPKALLLIPLLGSFFTDIVNATILKIFLDLSIFH